MGVQILDLQTKPLRRATSLDKYKLYQTALEWDLTEPIVIENKRDLRSEHLWEKRVEPYHHQITNLITFCRRLPVTLLADDVGLGKTISAGLIASELISRGCIFKILIVCPKLLIPQWKEELDFKFGIPAIEAIGQELVGAKPPGEAGAVITTYESARLYFEAIAKSEYEMLILDEAHKLRNLYGPSDAPQVALRFHDALAKRLFKYVLMLTATPIHNRLWDLYSLVSLLTAARGHENPFGSEGMFVRKFIADGRLRARKLRPDMEDEFRSIVYSYMSRVRRVDAKLHFPDRKVQLHRVPPTEVELELINIIAKPIQKLNGLSQISILQALTSSPHALAAQLETMANNGTVPSELALDVRSVVDKIKMTAKLHGLDTLIKQIKTEQSDKWRMVIFTGRRETQTSIEAFLEERGISCGLINGDSGKRNQQTIERFKKNPPEVRVIVSTEAGAEGVNLQVSNILVNFDLPWNPMRVEQRIGRIQRLASEHATVCIFNIILQGTFEEYIVGRLMEKLQMVSHAIGDIESILEAMGLDEDDGFEEKIRELVIASLAGKDIKKATELAEKNITDAKVELDREEQNINAMLAGGSAIDLGPRCPKLPPSEPPVDPKIFSLAALESLGAKISQKSNGFYEIELDGQCESICFVGSEAKTNGAVTTCKPGSPFFERLVNRLVISGLHWVKDLDQDPLRIAIEMGKNWVNSFNGAFFESKVEEVWRNFTGAALLRVRITVAHDSYERLVQVSCSSEEKHKADKNGLDPIGNQLENPDVLGLPNEFLKTKAMEDPGIAEFCRFYLERLTEEVRGAGDDLRKRKKLEDDFTPRVKIEVVGLEGKIYRQLRLRLSYKIKDENIYQSSITVIPNTNEVIDAPEISMCSLTSAIAPKDCIGKCAISGVNALRHLLRNSEVSNRMALPEHMVVCALSGKLVLSDEVEKSSITARMIASTILKTSALSGKRAEPEFFGRCEFSSMDVLQNELAISQISGKRYRIDEQLTSCVSGKTGHRSEFIFCTQTNKPLLSSEAERCEVTGKIVAPGILEVCEISGKKVLPSELETSPISGKKALRKFFITSSLSTARFLEQDAVRSVTGKSCSPLEAKLCDWSGRQSYPDDLRTCQLTGLKFSPHYMESDKKAQLKVLADLLDGVQKNLDKQEYWKKLATLASQYIGGKHCKVEAAVLSPNSLRLAVCLEVKSLFGFKIEHAGLIYSLQDQIIVGRVVLGKREIKGWLGKPILSGKR